MPQPKSEHDWLSSLPSQLFVFLLGLFLVNVLNAQDAVCAEVRIEIPQAASLERQAFNAQLGIQNGLAQPIQQFAVDLEFKDADGNEVVFTSDPNNLSAQFFVRLDSSPGITGGLAGQGVIAGQTSAEANWIIIPTAGAGGSLPAGKLYYLGASVRYVQNGEAKSLSVLPDSITVEPQPKLKLDYFLTKNVYADDPFTPVYVEPSVPFTLGVRIKNVGAGPSRQTAIESAQPRIVANKQGVPINFRIDGAFVQNEAVQNTLLLNFGEIGAQRSKVGRWLMSASLLGQFTDFEADFTHSDQLGGALTSLLESVTPHLLLSDVTVNLPGRDSVRDFLALDGDTLRTYESEGTETIVIDRSAGAQLLEVPAGSGQAFLNVFRLRTLVPSTLPLKVTVADPAEGTRKITQLRRTADNVLLPLENAWLSKVRRADADNDQNPFNNYDYFVNVYDALGSGDYLITYGIGVSSAIAGTVFRDQNGNSTQDPGEVGIAAATIRLNTIVAGLPIEKLVLTNTFGEFAAVGLIPGNYTMSVGAMPGLRDVAPIAGEAGGLASLQNGQAMISEITLAPTFGYIGYKFIKVATSTTAQAEVSILMDTVSPSVGIGETTDAVVRLKNNGPDAVAVAANLRVSLGGEDLVIVSGVPLTGSYDANVWQIPTLAVQEETTLAVRVRIQRFGTKILVGRVSTLAFPDPDTSNNVALLRLGASSIPGDLIFEDGIEAIQGLSSTLIKKEPARVFIGDAVGVAEVPVGNVSAAPPASTPQSTPLLPARPDATPNDAIDASRDHSNAGTIYPDDLQPETEMLYDDAFEDQ